MDRLSTNKFETILAQGAALAVILDKVPPRRVNNFNKLFPPYHARRPI